MTLIIIIIIIILFCSTAYRFSRERHLDGFDEVLCAEQAETNASEQRRDVLSSGRRVVVDPANDRLEDDLLVLDVKVVAADNLDHRVVGQHQQLVALRRDVREMLHYVTAKCKTGCHGNVP